jgi:hypothetical protein
MASTLNFSLPPFLKILSQKVISSSALERPVTVLQDFSNATFRAYWTLKKINSLEEDRVTRQSKKLVFFNTYVVKQTVAQKVILVEKLNYFSDEDLRATKLDQSLTFLTIPKNPKCTSSKIYLFLQTSPICSLQKHGN